MTRDEALTLLRSGQMPEYRYVQLCDENGWERGGIAAHMSKPDEVWRVEVAELRAENERLRADAVNRDKDIHDMAATIADLTTALEQLINGLDAEWGMWVTDVNFPHARAALARAQGGKE